MLSMKYNQADIMQINQAFSSIEKTFNVAATIPIVAVPSSMLRVTVSEIQMLASVIIGAFALIGQVVGSDFEKWENLTKSAKENLIHGALNFIRGLGELFLGLTVVGSLGLLSYQSVSSNKFEPVYKYGSVD